MVLLAVAVVGGLAAGLLRRPVGAHGTRLHLSRLPLLAVGAFGSALSQLLDGDVATLALGASLSALLAFVAANSHVTGVLVIGCGLLLNLVAVVLNNGMPVRGSALVRAGVVEPEELPTTGFAGPRHLETGTDRLGVLGDVLPVPFAREVLSFGDLIVVAGAADAVRDLARRRRRSWSTAERAEYRWAILQLDGAVAGTEPDAEPWPGTLGAPTPDRSAQDATDPRHAAPHPRRRPLVAAHTD